MRPANDDLLGSLKLHLHDFHCRQVLLACSSDGSYESSFASYFAMFHELASDGEAKQRLTLLHGSYVGRSFESLPFKNVLFERIFRNLSVETCGQIDLTTKDKQRHIGAPNDLLTPSCTPLPAPTRYHSGKDSAVIIPHKSHLRTSSTNSSAAMSESDGPPLTTWATLAKKTAALPIIDISQNTRQESVGILRNRKAQRIDPAPPPYDKNCVERLKSMKLCNLLYLRGSCELGKRCPHTQSCIICPKE